MFVLIFVTAEDAADDQHPLVHRRFRIFPLHIFTRLRVLLRREWSIVEVSSESLWKVPAETQEISDLAFKISCESKGGFGDEPLACHRQGFCFWRHNGRRNVLNEVSTKNFTYSKNFNEVLWFWLDLLRC